MIKIPIFAAVCRHMPGRSSLFFREYLSAPAEFLHYLDLGCGLLGGSSARLRRTEEPVKPTLLLLMEETPLRDRLQCALEACYYGVVLAATANDGLQRAALELPHVMLLDGNLPNTNGLAFIRQLREWLEIPILVFSAHEVSAPMRIAALDAGADDYLTPLVALDEVLARIRVAVRHTTRIHQIPVVPIFRIGEVSVDVVRRRVARGDQEIHLTPTEYAVLVMLMRHVGVALTHDYLLRSIWGPACTHEHHYLRVYIAQLRQKLEPDPARPRYLLTEPGVGYRLVNRSGEDG